MNVFWFMAEKMKRVSIVKPQYVTLSKLHVALIFVRGVNVTDNRIDALNPRR